MSAPMVSRRQKSQLFFFWHLRTCLQSQREREKEKEREKERERGALEIGNCRETVSDSPDHNGRSEAALDGLEMELADCDLCWLGRK